MQKSITAFHRELLEIVENAASLNKFLHDAKTVDKGMKKFLGILGEFNRKYGTTKLAFSCSVDRCSLRIFLKGNDVMEIFKGHAASIPGLKSLGIGTFDEVEISKEEESENLLGKVKEKIYLSYSSQESDTGFILEYSRKQKSVEVIYDPADIAIKSSPLVRVLSQVALKKFNQDIDIFKKHGHLGFSGLLSEEEKKQLLKKFNPHWRDA